VELNNLIMKEQDIIDLGFTRQDEYGTEVSDDTGAVWREDDYHYYVYDFALGFSLISSEFDHVTVGYMCCTPDHKL
jgi:hypothetical protein